MIRKTISLGLSILLLVLLSSALFGQDSKGFQFNVLPDFKPSPSNKNVTFSASFRAAPDGKSGTLSVTAELGRGWHIYSTTQKPGGPKRTEFVLQSEGVELAGPFEPDRNPKVKHDDIFPGVAIEEFAKKVTWTAPIRLSGQDPESVLIRGKIKGQICQDDGGCIPLSMVKPNTFEAKYAGVSKASVAPAPSPPNETSKNGNAIAKNGFIPSLDPIKAMTPTNVDVTPFRVGKGHATVEGYVVPGAAQPGQLIQLGITLKPDRGWHVYEYARDDEGDGIAKPTLVALTTPGWARGEPVASESPTKKGESSYYSVPITWTFNIVVPKDAQPGTQSLTGLVGYQACTDATCDRPTAAAFTVMVNVGEESDVPVGLAFATGSYRDAANAAKSGGVLSAEEIANAQSVAPVASGTAYDISKIEVEKTDQSLALILPLAFLGGFILNFMPCVLPVIGLKVMSFVQQAGENRRRSLMLNIWYSLGLLSIFWVLAILASAASLGLSDKSLGWGQQFNYDGFTIPLLALIFVMGLSFLGVWEIPIPGFASSKTANQLSEKEGYSGAFFKGVITTLLATPCSGPGLASALAYCAGKPPAIVFLVFTCVGLGMALPYLVIGAYPSLVRFIPKPGAWMDTFKQLMGFVLLATVVYMFTVISDKMVVPTVAFIFALWAACWWIGRVPIGESFPAKAKAWLAAAAFAGVIGYFAYGYEGDRSHQLNWQRFSLAKLQELTESQQTVLVDFTADW